MNDSSLSRGPRTPVVRMRSLGIRLHIIATPCVTHLNSRRVSVEFSPIRGRVWKRDGAGSCALLCQSFPSSSRSSNVFLDKNKQQISDYFTSLLFDLYSTYIPLDCTARCIILSNNVVRGWRGKTSGLISKTISKKYVVDAISLFDRLIIVAGNAVSLERFIARLITSERIESRGEIEGNIWSKSVNEKEKYSE